MRRTVRRVPEPKVPTDHSTYSDIGNKLIMTYSSASSILQPQDTGIPYVEHCNHNLYINIKVVDGHTSPI